MSSRLIELIKPLTVSSRRDPGQRLFSRAEALGLCLYGVLFVAGVGLWSVRYDYLEAQKKFSAKAAVVTDTITNRIHSGSTVLSSLVGFYQASELDGSQLTFTAQALLKDYPDLTAIGYLSWVPRDEQAEFEQTMVEQGFPQFTIHHPPGISPSQLTAPSYLAVSFLEPLTPRSATYLGMDLLADPVLTTVLQQAVDSGGSVSANAAYLVPDKSVYLLTKATYFGRFAPTTIDQRRQQVSGAFALAIDLDAMLSSLHSRNPKLALQLSQQSLDGAEILLAAAGQETAGESEGESFWGATLPVFDSSRTLRVDQESFQLRFATSFRRSDLNSGRLGLALLFAAALAICLISILHSRRHAHAARHAAQDAIFREQERAHVTLQSISDGVITTDTRLRIRYANPAAKQVTGLPDLVGQSAVETITVLDEGSGLPVFREPKADSIEDYLQRLPGVDNFVLQQPDGTLLSIAHAASPLRDREGRTIGAVLILRDVSRERQLARRIAERTEELKTSNTELARAVKSKDEFLATMSHELRTPLNAVLGLSEILQEELFGPLNEQQRSSLHTIEQSGRHLLALINDILDLAQMGSSDLPLDLGNVNIEAVCHSSLALTKPLADKRQLQVSFSIANACQSIRADERRLKQMLVNLLGNAVKFTPPGGHIGLEVSVDERSDSVLFSVWDTGIGIDEKNFEHLFQPFKQLDSQLSRQFEGSGLGLSLVFNMAKLHGGTVTVESRLEQGSRFTLSLPRQGCTAEPEATTAVDAVSLSATSS